MIADTSDRLVHLEARSTRLEVVYACGKTWPRELWGNARAPLWVTQPEKVTCPGCRKGDTPEPPR